MAGTVYKRAYASYGAVAAVVIALLPHCAKAEEPGDPRSGLPFALKNCAECHAVRSTDDKSPNPQAPSFASVAGTRGITGRALAVWLQTSHPTMPNLVISKQDRDDIIAYIMSLKLAPAQ
jgi:mono/diheme cytochrome c family protein